MAARTTWPLGVQVMPWMQARGIRPLDFNRARAALPEVLRSIGAIGLTGFEAILPFIPLETPGQILDAIAATGGLHLAAAHAAGPWCEESSEARIPAIVEQARMLPAIGCDRLVVSLSPRPATDLTADHLRSATRTLGLLGRACRETAGVRLLFHNHPWEMTDDARFISALVDECEAEDVSLAPDLGWVAIGRMAPEAFRLQMACV